jgi:hypothetical protein
MTMQDWQHQLYLEREQMLEEALLRAERNEADEDDWKVIYFECGKTRRSKNESTDIRT